MRLRDVRVLKRMTQCELEARTGVFASRLSLLERGYAMPKPEEKKRLAKALGLRVREIDWGTKEGA